MAEIQGELIVPWGVGTIRRGSSKCSYLEEGEGMWRQNYPPEAFGGPAGTEILIIMKSS